MNHVLGITEIARELGVDPNTVAQWKHRGKLPPPNAFVGGRPVWDRETIKKWKETRS